MKKTFIVLAALVALLMGSLPAGAQTASSNTFTVVAESSPTDLDPASSYDEFSNIPLRGIYEGLVTLKGESLTETVPVLAESVDNQNDTVYTFKLRKGVLFHDDAPFNAQAAKTSLTRTITSKLGTAGILGTFLTDPAKMMTTPDDSTLVVTFGSPQPLFLVALAASYGTGIVSPKVLSQYPDPGKLHEYLTTHEAGTGPYMLKAEMKTDQPVTLVRFQKYWQGWSGTHFDSVVIKTVPQSAQRRRALEKGEANAATSLLPDDLLKLQAAGGYQINKTPTLRLDYLIMNTSTRWLKKATARQAMAYAFDYAAYNRAELGGLGRQPNGPFPQSLLGAAPGTFTYTTDLKKAKQLLDQAGVPAGETFVFAAPEGRGDTAGAILKQQLEQIGYFVEIKKYSSDDYYSYIMQAKQPDGDTTTPDFMLQAWWPDYNSPLNFALPIFYSGSIGEAGQNAGQYKNATVDKIIEAGKKAKTIDEMVKLFVDLQQTVASTDPAGIFMAQAPDRTVVSAAIKGHTFNVLYLGTFDFYALSR